MSAADRDTAPGAVVSRPYRPPTPAQLAAVRKASKASPWRHMRACDTPKAREHEASYVEKLSKRWGKE